MSGPAVPRLWICGTAFGTRVLRGGENPWRAPEQLGLFQRELSSLLSLEVVDIDIEPALEAFTETRSPAIDTVDGAAVEMLLARSDLAAFLSRGIETVMGVMGGHPLGLSLPGPGRLASLYLSAAAIDEGVLDDLSLALTVLVRKILRPGVGFLRISEDDPRALEFMAPLTNLAAHYDCTPLLVLRGEAASSAEPHDFDFVYRDTSPAADEGAILPPDYWRAGSEPPRGASLYAEVPADCVPETVLAKLAGLTGPAV